MELGVGLFTCQQRPDDDRSVSALYDEMLSLVQTAEASGLDSAWVSEHHFLADGYLSGVVPALGSLAAVTDDIEIGPCIALAPLYDSVRLAEDAATVDLLSDGRLTVGLAIGSNVREFDAFGVPRDERVERLEDTVGVLRGAWSPGPLEYEAEFHDVPPDVTVTPKPAHEIPLMIGGTAKPAVRRAARIGDAWCASSSLSIEGIRKRVEDIRRVRREANRDGEFDVYLVQYGFVGDSREDAWRQMHDGFRYSQRRYEEIFTGDTVDSLSSDRIQELKSQAIFGTPAQVVDELSAYQDALGDDVHVVFRAYHPGLETDVMERCIERLGEEVRPRID